MVHVCVKKLSVVGKVLLVQAGTVIEKLLPATVKFFPLDGIRTATASHYSMIITAGTTVKIIGSDYMS